jgi:hypothetical protein
LTTHRIRIESKLSKSLCSFAKTAPSVLSQKQACFQQAIQALWQGVSRRQRWLSQRALYHGLQIIRHLVKLTLKNEYAINIALAGLA